MPGLSCRLRTVDATLLICSSVSAKTGAKSANVVRLLAPQERIRHGKLQNAIARNWLILWRARGDLNARPLVPETSALSS